MMCSTLPDAYEALVNRANKLGRLEWIMEETSIQFDLSRFDPDPEELWRKIKKAGNLRARNAVVLRELAIWRDRIARAGDKPVRYIISDEAMIELAKADRLNLDVLGARRGLQPRFIERYGKELIECHQHARKIPKDEWPDVRSLYDRGPSEQSEALADLAWLMVKEIAKKSDMAPNNLVSKKGLTTFIDAYLQGRKLDDFPLHQGWRGAMVGKPLINFIEGRVAVKVENRRIVWQELSG